MNNQIFRAVFGFIALVLLQALFGKSLIIQGYAFCLFYVAYLLAIPFEMGRMTYMFLGFALGLVMDVFHDTLGMHAAACVLLCFLRDPVKALNSPSGGYEANIVPNVSTMGLQWFLGYSVPLVLAHHLLFFLLEASNTSLIFPAIVKAIFSTAFTLLVIVAVQTSLTPKKTRR